MHNLNSDGRDFQIISLQKKSDKKLLDRKSKKNVTKCNFLLTTNCKNSHKHYRCSTIPQKCVEVSNCMGFFFGAFKMPLLWKCWQARFYLSGLQNVLLNLSFIWLAAVCFPLAHLNTSAAKIHFQTSNCNSTCLQQHSEDVVRSKESISFHNTYLIFKKKNV